MNDFPHCCIYCQKYYPKNDKSHVMKGGGECWSWSGMKGGDSRVNSCQDFAQMSEKAVFQKAMYVVKAIRGDENFKFVFSDSFLHVKFAEAECLTLAEGKESVLGTMDALAAHFKKCVSALSAGRHEGKAVRTQWSKPKDETITNPQSETRRRFNTVMRGFPRNVQLSYKFLSDEGSRAVKLRIYNTDGGLKLEISDDMTRSFLGVKEYIGKDAVNAELVSVILGEFRDFAKFANALKREFEKA